MRFRFGLSFLLALFAINSFAAVPGVFYFKEAKGTELLAAKELQRYLYLRTGQLPSLVILADDEPLSPNSILVATQTDLEHSIIAKNIPNNILLADQDYSLTSLPLNRLLITGGSEIAALYGAYHFLQTTGIGFALHDDIIPDEKISRINLTGFNNTYKPAFALRGIQPFHDFPEGPDWWSEDDYKAIITQLPKLGMNFIGLHTYPEDGPKAEPTVWIGTKKMFSKNGTVKAAYPNLYFNTGDPDWGFAPEKTSAYSFGASMLFETDVFGAGYMKNISPWPHTKQENINNFNRVGLLLNHAFTLAQTLGVKTCIGTETPLIIPRQLKARLRNPGSDSVKEQLYEGIFSRIMATHPLDYYWFWTPEGWTWSGETAAQVNETEKDLAIAVKAAKKVNAPFTLATCGWVLGPNRDRTEFDNLLPKNMPFSAINRSVGYSTVDTAFKNISGRPKWEIAWLEDDGALSAPEFWAGRVLKDAADAYEYGCTGLMGIHWRTQNLAPAIMALAQAGWLANTYATVKTRDYPVANLYHDWAVTEFGEQAGPQAGIIFNSLDGTKDTAGSITKFPHSSNWLEGPGEVTPEKKPWNEVKKGYDFIADFEKLGLRITGAGNKERYQYWLNTFYYAREQGRIACLLGEIDTAVSRLKRTSSIKFQRNIVGHILGLRAQAANNWGKMVTYLLQKVNTTGELGTIANLEQHNLKQEKALTQYDKLLSSTLGKPVPPLNFSKTYTGYSRLVVTTKRTLLNKAEDLNLMIRVLSKDGVYSAIVYWKPLGEDQFKSKPVAHLQRGVYALNLPATAFNNNSFEYFVEVKLKTGTLRYPAGNADQTVVVW